MYKKILFLSIAFLAIASAMPASAYYSYNEGDLIKTSNNPAVYYVDNNGYRHSFVNSRTFFSWYTGSWSNINVKTISQYDFDSLRVGKNITVRPGSALIHFSNNLIMYAVTPNNTLCTAPAHYGNYQYNRAISIPAILQSDYIIGACDITESRNLPDGSLFSYYGSSDIYYVQNSQKRRVTNNGFAMNNFRYESVITNINSSMYYSDGNVLDGREPIISTPITTTYNYNNYNYNYCNENWLCGSWSSCSNSYQYRTCWDGNSCGTNRNKPIEGQSCYSCQNNWTCGSWSSCAYGNSYRTCWDLNSCGNTTNKPIETQTCATCSENWSCTNWGTCQGSNLSGYQYRTCSDKNSCGTYVSQPATSRTCTYCSPNWSCTDWTVGCTSGNKQTRSCIDLNSCSVNTNKPAITRTCQ